MAQGIFFFPFKVAYNSAVWKLM